MDFPKEYKKKNLSSRQKNEILRGVNNDGILKSDYQALKIKEENYIKDDQHNPSYLIKLGNWTCGIRINN